MNQLNTIRLDDCFTKNNDLALMNGVQALVRLLIEQAKLDKDNGLLTKGYVSGYPGSPLGTLDLELGRAKIHLDKYNIVFQPAVNEELAATAAWGTQMLGLYDKPEIDGVFSMWYGKGPGLDRAMDALRHANMGGVALKGGMVLAVADDPIGKSSTLAYQSEQSLISAGIPVFYPANVDEVITLGLQAFALSRHAGICVALKITSDTADSNAVIDLGNLRPNFLKLDPPSNVHVNRHDPALDREAALIKRRIPATRNFIKQNKINKIIFNPQKKKLGIISVGKAATETIDAFERIGIKNPEKSGIGFFACKIPWPLIDEEIIDFCEKFEEILVIEEKGSIVEEQVAHILFNSKSRPLLSGKFDSTSKEELIPNVSELSSDIIADCLLKKVNQSSIEFDLPKVKSESLGSNLPPVASRTPWYCAGCPHNSGTKTPDDEVVGIGIGCHSIGYFLHPEKLTNFSQMGGAQNTPGFWGQFYGGCGENGGFAQSYVLTANVCCGDISAINYELGCAAYCGDNSCCVYDANETAPLQGITYAHQGGVIDCTAITNHIDDLLMQMLGSEDNTNLKNRKIIETINILGKPAQSETNSILFDLYDDGTVIKKILLK